MHFPPQSHLSIETGSEKKGRVCGNSAAGKRLPCKPEDSISTHRTHIQSWAGAETAQGLRDPIALAEALSLVPSTHVRRSQQPATPAPGVQHSSGLHGHLHSCTQTCAYLHMHVHTHVHTFKSKIDPREREKTILGMVICT